MIYLDHNATTRPDPVVVEAMLPYLEDRFGNAASSHVRGRAAAKVVEEASVRVASLVGTSPSRVVWTSGATESLNTALQAAVAAGSPSGRDQLVVSVTEHKAVLDPARLLADRGEIELVEVAPRQDGSLDLDHLEALVGARTAAVAVMAANNETGVCNPIERVGLVAQQAGAAFVCDATQQLGKVAFSATECHADYVALSAHKLYGPQGVGALAVPMGHPPEVLIRGGGHQRGWRSGTLNLPGIVGLGEAARLAEECHAAEAERITGLRDLLERLLAEQAEPVTVNGGGARRLPNTTNLRLHGVDGDALVANCPQVAFATGSACTSAVPAPSHVLTAMGCSREHAEESVRFSLGRRTTKQEIHEAAAMIAAAAARLRDLDAAA